MFMNHLEVCGQKFLFPYKNMVFARQTARKNTGDRAPRMKFLREFILMDDGEPYTRHQIFTFLSGYLPKNIPLKLHEIFLMHIYKMDLIVPAYFIATLKSNILYEYNDLILKKSAKLTTIGYNDDAKKRGIILLKVKNDVILNEGSWIDLKGSDNKGNSGGGAITIECNKLIINKQSGICCDGRNMFISTHNGNSVAGDGGSIHIICNEFINKGSIHAKGYNCGKIRIDCNKIEGKGDIIPKIKFNLKRKRDNQDGQPSNKRRKVLN